MTEFEIIPEEEAAQIERIIQSTVRQMEIRYPGGAGARRGQHAKDHACLSATLKVRDDLPADMQVGVLASPGKEYGAWVRYSNAAAKEGADSPVVNGVASHGSRGMAVKIMGVSGAPLLTTGEVSTQDFLMINHPAFPFANVEDYEALSKVLEVDPDNPFPFFTRRKGTDTARDLTDAASRRAWRSFDMVMAIRSMAVDAKPAALQAPPASPVDNVYFGGAPFLFGEGRAMRISVRPLSPMQPAPEDLTDDAYLRTALRRRLMGPEAQEVVFAFEIQVRSASELAGKLETEIEDASVDWKTPEFTPVATITIPPQDFETAERRAMCEGLFFTPWHGLAEHRPLGGINRLRRAVYEASAKFRQALHGAAPV